MWIVNQAGARRGVGMTLFPVAILALSGCLVSERPLLNDTNATANPVKPGSYQACGEDNDCKSLTVTREGSVTSFAPQGDDPSLGRFRALGRGAFLAEMWEDGDSAYFYFYVRPTPKGANMAMIVCEEIPASTRVRLVKTGDLSVSDDETTCTANTLKGAEQSARAWARARGRGGDWTVLTRSAP